jgi:hypothetical protein
LKPSLRWNIKIIIIITKEEKFNLPLGLMERSGK